MIQSQMIRLKDFSRYRKVFSTFGKDGFVGMVLSKYKHKII